MFEAGSGHLRGLPVLAGQGPETVRGMSNNPPYTCALPGSPVSPGGFAVASQTGMRGGNGSWAALYGPDPVTDARLNLALDEDQLNDAERSHITERVNYVVLAGPCAARTRAAVDVGFLCDFGCPLAPTTMRSTSFAVFDCVTRQARLTTVDAFFCRP